MRLRSCSGMIEFYSSASFAGFVNGYTGCLLQAIMAMTVVVFIFNVINHAKLNNGVVVI